MKQEQFHTLNRIVQEAKQGNASSMDKLLRSFQPLLWKLSDPRDGSPTDRELHQELSIHLWELIQSYDEKKNPYFASYIKQRLTWARGDYLRRKWRHEKKFTPLHEAKLSRQSSSFYEGEAVTIRDVAGFLPFTPRQRDVFIAMAEGRKTGEMMKQLGISQQALYKHKKAVEAIVSRREKEIRNFVYAGGCDLSQA